MEINKALLDVGFPPIPKKTGETWRLYMLRITRKSRFHEEIMEQYDSMCTGQGGYHCGQEEPAVRQVLEQWFSPQWIEDCKDDV